MTEVCLDCKKKITARQKFICCVLCERNFHQTCYKIPESDSSTALEILKSSWSCSSCRTEYKDMKNANKSLTAENMNIKGRLEALEIQFETIRQSEELNCERTVKQEN